jgi:hypothetical protein
MVADMIKWQPLVPSMVVGVRGCGGQLVPLPRHELKRGIDGGAPRPRLGTWSVGHVAWRGEAS